LVDLNLAGIRRIAKKSGAARMSIDALEYLLNVTESLVEVISKKAYMIAIESGKKKVEKIDVIKAVKSLGLNELFEGEINI